MKKLLSILIALSLAAAFVYADETDDIMENLSKEDEHIYKEKNGL